MHPQAGKCSGFLGPWQHTALDPPEIHLESLKHGETMWDPSHHCTIIPPQPGKATSFCGPSGAPAKLRSRSRIPHDTNSNKPGNSGNSGNSNKPGVTRCQMCQVTGATPSQWSAWSNLIGSPMATSSTYSPICINSRLKRVGVQVTLDNVNPGWINPKPRLFNWEGTIEVLDEMTIGGVPPWHYKMIQSDKGSGATTITPIGDIGAAAPSNNEIGICSWRALVLLLPFLHRCWDAGNQPAMRNRMPAGTSDTLEIQLTCLEIAMVSMATKRNRLIGGTYRI